MDNTNGATGTAIATWTPIAPPTAAMRGTDRATATTAPRRRAAAPKPAATVGSPRRATATKPAAIAAPTAPTADIRRVGKIWNATADDRAEQVQIGNEVKASGKPAPRGTRVHMDVNRASGRARFVVAKTGIPADRRTWIAAGSDDYASMADALADAAARSWTVVSGTR